MANEIQTGTGSRSPPEFDYSGGVVCLDFTNTVSGRNGPLSIDRLESYSDLITWARLGSVIDGATASDLETEARRQTDRAAAILADGRRLREAIYQVFSAVADRNTPNGRALERLNRSLGVALGMAKLTVRDGGVVLTWREEPSRLDRVLWPIVRSAAELLTAPEVNRVRECSARTCAWLFLDTTKNRSRHWCDMKVCGNREKARRHYRRAKSQRTGAIPTT